MADSIEELKDKVGIEQELGVYEIEKGMIRRFVQAIGDPNPLWQDEEYARKSQYSHIIAPPTFILPIGFDQIEQLFASTPGTLLHGSTELECYQPVKPGDVITVISKITQVRERDSSRLGKMIFITFDITYKNQQSEIMAKCRQLIISYQTEEVRHG